MTPTTQQPPATLLRRLGGWFLPKQPAGLPVALADERLDWARVIPYALIHLMCLAVIWVGWSWAAVGVAVFLYALRVFALTGFYHRYFAHRTFKTGRITQFLFGWIGSTSLQRGPLWWAAHHRHHHAHSDDPEDIHSPRQKGILWSHMCWFLTPRASATNVKLIPDFAKYPELRWLDRNEFTPAMLLGLALFGLGELLAIGGIATTGLQMVVWGLFISTVAVYHVTYLVNSATHLIGRRRYETKDDSRNSMVIALLTFGEGWHNNHHYYPNSVRQGFFWWEIDITYYLLRLMAVFGLVWQLRPVPKRILHVQAKQVAEPAIPAATVTV
ncbi:MAG: acyl-CoA desaturase [Gemmataceae bacterium]|nr:acyl-CoA desaturase [Gemmataceae bacterium]